MFRFSTSRCDSFDRRCTVFQQSVATRQSFVKLSRENTFKVSRPRLEVEGKLLLFFFSFFFSFRCLGTLGIRTAGAAFARIFARNK